MTPEQSAKFIQSVLDYREQIFDRVSEYYGYSDVPTAKPPALEEGDIVTIQHSSVGNFTGRVDKVVPMGRGEYHMTLTKVPEEGECKN